MALTPVTIEDFPGLDLRQPVNSPVGLNVHNVSWDKAGAIGQRPGYSTFVTSSSRPLGIALYRQQFAKDILVIAANTTNMKAVDGVGTTIASGNLPIGISNQPATFASIGTPTANTMFVAAGGLIQNFNGTAFAAAPALTANCLSVSPTDNRLAIGSQANTSRVYFSDPGAPTTVNTAQNFVDLTPGDGEEIAGMLNWRELLFVFKQSKFFVFYGNTTDLTGNAIFNYRAVDGKGVRDSIAGDNLCCVGPDGVYFLSDDGIYRTTGGPPQKMSQALDPYFNHIGSPYFFTNNFFVGQSTTTQYLGYSQGKLYFQPDSNGQEITFVYDFLHDRWATWILAGGAAIPIGCADMATSITPDDRRYTMLSLTNNTIVRVDSTLVQDNATIINSNYRSGFSDFGVPGEKTVREVLLDGYGAPIFQWSRDWKVALDSGTSVTLGTDATTMAQNRYRVAKRGRLLGYQLSGIADWSVQRMQLMVRSSRQPGAHTT